MNLPFDYIAGLVDGEGCFSLRCYTEVKHHRRNKPTYFRWQTEFVIVMREDDTQLLQLVQNTIGCGTITKSQGMVRYSVQDINKLSNIIVPFFKKYPLYGRKRMDFGLWSEAIEIIYKHSLRRTHVLKGNTGFIENPWSQDEFNRLQTLHQKIVNH